MMKYSKVAIALGMLGTASVQAGELLVASNPDNVIQDQYIVVFKNESPSANQTLNSNGQLSVLNQKVSQLSNQFNLAPSKKFGHVIQAAVYQMDEATAKAMAEHPAIAFIEPDERVSIFGTQNNPTWGLDRLDQRGAQLDSQYTYETNASNVNAYILDTGVSNHSDFNGRVKSGWDFVDNDSNASDCQGHGTHVAGTVGSSTWGVAKGATIYGVRVLDCQGSGSNSGIIDGMDWVAQNHIKPAVANMSLGGGSSSAIDQAANNLVAAGVVTVVAAGNDNSNACNYSPARASNVITVGSTAQGDSRSSFSNYGSCIDIFAPGSNITSTSINGGSTTLSGTSMASPHVAGAAALYMAANPNATPAQVEQGLLNAATSNAISDVKGSPNKLLYSLFGATPPPPPPTENILENGVPAKDLSASTGNDVIYTMDVPADASNVQFAISGGTGDADLYVSFGSSPTDSSYDCRPYKDGNNESCSMTQSGGTYFVRVKAYQSFSGLTLTGSYDGSSNPPPTGNPPIDESMNNISMYQGEWVRYYYDLPEGYSNMTISISGGTGDADLYVKHGSQSSSSNYDCRPYKNGNNESCEFNNPAAGKWHIDIYGYAGASGITLRLKAE